MMQPTGTIAIIPRRISHSAAFISIVCPQKVCVRVAADLDRTLAYGCAFSEPPQDDSLDVSCRPPKASTLPLNSRNAGRFR
jgi:hypothetical protein